MVIKSLPDKRFLALLFETVSQWQKSIGDPVCHFERAARNLRSLTFVRDDNATFGDCDTASFGGRGLEVRVVAPSAAVRIEFDSPFSKLATLFRLSLTATPVPIPKISHHYACFPKNLRTCEVGLSLAPCLLPTETSFEFKASGFALTPDSRKRGREIA
jgi:hypothetical protein